MFSDEVSYSYAFLTGILSFFSPCILPLIPAYFSLITGLSLDELIKPEQKSVRAKIFFSTLSYVLGFSVVFILMGASASYLGGLILTYKNWLRIIGGIIIIILGIHLCGLLKIDFLNIEKRIYVQNKNIHIFGVFIIGMAFAAGWTPCIGPVLSSILILASSKDTVSDGVILLSIYSLGLAIPFIILSLSIQYLLTFIAKAKKILKYINITAGILLIIIGVFLISNINIMYIL